MRSIGDDLSHAHSVECQSRMLHLVNSERDAVLQSLCRDSTMATAGRLVLHGRDLKFSQEPHTKPEYKDLNCKALYS